MSSDLRWLKARRSGSSGNCVEVARDGDTILMRDSKDPTGPRLRFTEPEFEAFVGGAKDGDFDDL